MAALLLKAQEEERLGQVTRCDDAGELREFLADIRAHRVTWGVDVTTTARSNLVGLDFDAMTMTIDTLVGSSEIGPLAVVDAR